MDKSKFTDNALGKLIPAMINHFGQEREDISFLPNPLPSSFELPSSLWPELSDAREELARLDAVGDSLSNPLLLLNPIQRREALTSSSLEGTFSSPKELVLFELQNEASQSATSEKEINNYTIALRTGAIMLEDYPFSLSLVRELHRILLTGTRGEDKKPGEIRDGQVHIGADRRFIPPPAIHLTDCLDNFENFMKNLNTDKFVHPLIACYMLHYQFETIHPFRDGNGRIGRLLLALTIWKWCGHNLPWLYMSPFFEKYKDEYIQGMFDVSANGDWEKWLKLCLVGTKIQAKDTINRIQKLTVLKDNMIRRIGLNNSVRLVKLIETLFDRPILTAPMVSEICGVTNPTARQDIAILEVNGIITRTDWTLKPITFIAEEIFEIAYDD